MTALRKRLCLPLAFLASLALGCAGTASVSGTVTYDGKPIERGKISFLPLDDKGEIDGKVPAVSSDIVKGQYAVKDVPMGKKKVAILALDLGAVAKPHAQENKTGQKPPQEPKLVEPLIPPEVTKDLAAEINTANQTVHFDLKKPDRPAGDAPKN